jgi:hypothetical protein
MKTISFLDFHFIGTKCDNLAAGVLSSSAFTFLVRRKSGGKNLEIFENTDIRFSNN